MAEQAQQRSEESVKLFVGQVPKHLTEAQLVALFREFALVDEVNIIKDKNTRASRGCCFVICPSREEADKAVNGFHNKKTLPGASCPLQVKYADGELERLEHKLFVGMLSKNVSEAEVSSLFSNYGTIKELQILRGSLETSKGCAFLKYETKEQAIAAMEALNGKHKMEGLSFPLVVKWADTEKERQKRRLQKAHSQASRLANANPQNPSLFGALPMGYAHPYNGYGYHGPGPYGYIQYRLPPLQNQGNFHNMISPTNQGIQYPLAYTRGVINSLALSTSPCSLSPGVSNSNLATSSSASTSSVVQAEGPPGANLFICNIPQEYGDKELGNAFQQFGMILSAKVFMDKATGASKCFGFVSFDSPASAHNAITAMNGRQLGGKKLKVQLKRDNKRNGKLD